MNAQTNPIYVEVLGILQIEGHVLASVKLLSGRIDVDMILEAEETGEQWRLVSFTTIPGEAYAKGIRSVEVEVMSDKAEIRPGMRLFVRN